MNNEISEMLDEELKCQIENLNNLVPGTNEHATAVESIAKMYKLKLEEEKNTDDKLDKIKRREMDECKNSSDEHLKELQIKNDLDTKMQQLENETDFNAKQAKKECIGKYIGYAIDVIAIGTTVVFNWVWMNRGFEFEKSGVYTSDTFKWLHKGFKSKK